MNLQKQLYGVGIFEEEIVLSDFTSGAEKRYIIDFDQLKNFFRSAVTIRPFPGLIWMKNLGDSETYLFTLPAATRSIQYRQGKKLLVKKISLPSLLISANIDSHIIKSIALWCFSGKNLTPKTRLYALPLPNITDARLCLGSTIKAVDSDIRAAIERTVFDTPFNHHADYCGKEKISFGAYIRKYKGKSPISSLAFLSTARSILGAAL